VHKTIDFTVFVSAICVVQLEGNVLFTLQYFSLHSGNISFFVKCYNYWELLRMSGKEVHDAIF